MSHVLIDRGHCHEQSSASPSLEPRTYGSRPSLLRASDGLGILVRVEAVLFLQLLNKLHIFGLGFSRSDTFVNYFLPGLVLCLVL